MPNEVTKEKVDIELEAPASFTSPDELYNKLINAIRRYHPSDDISMIERAYQVASEAHKTQARKSGEPYIIHPLCVAIILADLEMDKETIAAGLLHDVIEDTPVTKEELAVQFGEDVAFLVEGVSKLTRADWKNDKIESQAENLRKLFLAMAKDIRVIIIKLADRLHNMRTGQFWKPEKQKEKARETMEIYAPIADRLGISKIKIELDDLSLRFLKPEVYFDLVDQVERRAQERETFIENIIKEVRQQVENTGIQATVNGRVKHFFSIYKKMVRQNKTIDEIYDLFAVRILVDSVKDCYAALGAVHEKYRPIPGRFKDYIAMPKPNRYQSLHTTVISTSGQPFEVQIRTYEMHRVAEYGVAAHWKYKESGNSQGAGDGEAVKMAWLRQILEWQNEKSGDFLNLLKEELDLFSSNVFCFTPSGDVKDLPSGSTTIDFAYSIHSAVGNKMVGARVNGKQVPIDYVIQNGDRIEVITSPTSKGPSRDWLKVVKSPQAKSKINQWFKNEGKEENIVRGKDLLERYCKAKSINWSELNKPEYVDKVLERYGFRSWDAVLASLGHGGIKEGQIINKMIEEREKKKKREMKDSDVLIAIADNAKKEAANPKKMERKSGIVVKGIHDLAVRFSHCCNPVPGDEIVGFITRGRGISIHRKDCVNMVTLPDEEKARLIDAHWEIPEGANNERYSTEIKIFVNDRVGMFTDISNVFTDRQINITSMNMRSGKRGTATINMTFDIHGMEELNSLIDRVRQIRDVLDIVRVKG